MLNQDEFRISESEEGWEGHEYDCYKKGSSNAISTKMPRIPLRRPPPHKKALGRPHILIVQGIL